MNQSEIQARIEAAESIWHDAAYAHLAQGDVSSAVACLHQYQRDIEHILAAR